MGMMKAIEFSQNSILRATQANHSDLAMTAAKEMRRTRYKEKTGHVICRHLLDMLAEQSPPKVMSRATRPFWIEPHNYNNANGANGANSVEIGGMKTGMLKNAKRQFSLSL